MIKISGLFVTVSLVLGGYGSIAVASPTPATLHISNGYGTPCDTGGCFIYNNNEVNNVGTPRAPGTPYTGPMDIYQNKGSASALDHMSLIFGVPDKYDNGSHTALSTSSLSGGDLIDSSGKKTSIGFTFSGGYKGLMTKTSNTPIYSLVDPLVNNGSNSFTNWAAADLAVNKIDVSKFGIYKFDLALPNNVSFGAKNFINIALKKIPLGTFAVAYGQSSDKNTYITPFTQSGLVDAPVPEPGSLLIFAFGLALLAIGRTVSIRRLRRG